MFVIIMVSHDIVIYTGLLQSEVFQLKEHLSSMARELAEREGKEREGGDMDSLGTGSTQEEEGEEDSLREINPSERMKTN